MEPAPGIVPNERAIQSPPVDFTKTIAFENLRGKTILITGGASGIGAKLASEFASHGANVTIGDINELKGTELVTKLRSSSNNNNHHFLNLDVADWNSQVTFFKDASRLSPNRGIDCVVANAGINDNSETEAFELNIPSFSSIENPPPPRLKTLRVDLDGVLYTTTLALSYLSENPGSDRCSLKPEVLSRDRHLLLVSSIAGVMPMPLSSIYGAAKHGVVGLFRSIRITAPILHGVRVNLICPQYVETPMLGARGTSTLLGIPKTRIEDVAEAAIRLSTNQATIGRALMVGARMTDEQGTAAGLDHVHDKHIMGAIWDIHAHDFEQTDLLMRRVVAMLNIATKMRGWVGFTKDLFAWIFAFLLELWNHFVLPYHGLTSSNVNRRKSRINKLNCS